MADLQSTIQAAVAEANERIRKAAIKANPDVNLADIATANPNWDPTYTLVELAVTQGYDPNVRRAAAATLMPYLHSKKGAGPDDDGTVSVIVDC